MDQYVCSDADSRTDSTRADGRFNGVDGVEVDTGHPPGVPAWRTLVVDCLLPLPNGIGATEVEIRSGTAGGGVVPVLWAYPADRLAAAHEADPARVSGQDVEVFGALPDAASTLVVRTATVGSASMHHLEMTDPQAHGFDPRLAGADFTFRVDCPQQTDCEVTPSICPPERAPAPVIDYLNRDYTSLRGMLLDRLSLVLPQWVDRNIADVGVMLIELFAYVGDHLASAQDAVTAEAYLGTARQRVSVARHARLLDYRMHQGVAARTWVVSTAGRQAEALVVEAGREICSSDGSTVFHTLHPLTLHATQNEIPLYTWGELRCCLPRGATTATLVGTAAGLGLRAGDALLLEEIRGGAEGRLQDADRTHRWVVRLATEPQDDHDPVTGTDLVAVTWGEQDALPFPLCAWSYPQGRCDPPVNASVARGNIVLVEHGRLIDRQPLVPPRVPDRGLYRPSLPDAGLAFCVPYDDTSARALPAVSALDLQPQLAVPAVVSLSDGHRAWAPARDLLDSTPFATGFVVEMHEDGRAGIRFGDGTLGRRPTPGDRFTAGYRLGGGTAGNVGADVLTSLVEPVEGVSVRNPVAAAGGADPQDVEQVRQWAPQAFRVQERAVTDDDYAEVAKRDPRVQRAVATRRWTGSWYTELVTVDRMGGRPVDGSFRADIHDRLERVRMAGYDVAVEAPTFVALDIVLTVLVAPGHLRDTVRKALRMVFSPSENIAGPGFFHPDRFTFAQPVFLSAVVATATAVPGVRWVDTAEQAGSPNRFQRWGLPPQGERDAGLIRMNRLEVARCDSDPDRPENGRIDFVLEGGS